jgi:hypothetical protein
VTSKLSWSLRAAGRIAAIAIAIAVDARAAEDLDHAREVFRQALVLEVAGDWASALAKYQEVSRTRLTPQVRYHLARCKEHLGRLTEALGDYRVAEDEARAGSLEETSEMERARRDLEARVPRLLVHARNVDTSTAVELDGIVVGGRVLDSPMVVNPGWHQIALRDSSGNLRASFVNAEEGKLVEVDLGIITPTLSPRPAGESTRPVATVSRYSLTPTWAYVSAGIGLAAVGTSVALFIVRDHARRELDQNCAGRLCPDEMRSVQERGERASVAAPVALGLGAAGLGLAAWGFWGQARGGRPNSNRGGGGSSTVSAVAVPGKWGVNLEANF